MSSDDVYGGDDYKDTDLKTNTDGNVINGNKNSNSIGNLLSFFSDDNQDNMDVRIVDTEERKGKITKYTVYIIEASVYSSSSSSSVARRYNDFKWLYNILGIEFVGVFIPALPPSNVFERFNSEIISQRRYDLERFLNRISESKILKQSTSFELFLCETDENIYEQQKKIHRKELLDRSDYDIISLLNKSFINLDDEPIPDHLTGTKEKGINNMDDDNDFNDNTFILDIPRLREFFTRCDERFTALNKISNNLFKIFSNITSELSVFNQGLNELYDYEYNDRPSFMINDCQQRYNIRDFMSSWHLFNKLQMNCYYKYFLLNLRYEAEDIKSILDIFRRYDIIYNKYKKNKIYLKKQKDKYPDKDYNQLEDNLINNKNLLYLICKIILISQTPKLWNKKIKTYNKAVASYIDKITQ